MASLEVSSPGAGPIQVRSAITLLAPLCSCRFDPSHPTSQEREAGATKAMDTIARVGRRAHDRPGTKARRMEASQRSSAVAVKCDHETEDGDGDGYDPYV